MKKCRAILKDSSGNRGVAIVVVLGLIAVLMMMAVAFSIHMRVERTGASNYRYGVQARHMVWAGLANSIRDIDALMKNADGSAKLFPDWSVAASDGSGRAGVLTRTAAEYIPQPLQEEVRTADAKWKYIEDGGVSRGRYAFIILNSSGLLDANRVGGRGRLAGESPREIQLDYVPGVTDASQFTNKLASDGRYETFPELVNVNRRVGDGRSFSVFSLAPVNEKYDAGGISGRRAYIGSENSLWKSNDIIAAFAEAGVPDPSLAYLNLLDYTDSDSAPQSLSKACVERTPMINEIGLLCDVNFNGAGQLTGNLALFIEWVYPFVVGTDKAFTMHYDVTLTQGAGNSITGCVPLIAGSYDVASLAGAAGIPPMQFGSVDKAVTFSGSTTNATASVDFKLNVSAYVTLSGARVDEVPSPYSTDTAKNVELAVTALNMPRGTSRMITNSWEALDPRFNWDPKNGLYWYPSTMLSGFPAYQVSYRAENFVTRLYFDPAAFGGPNTMDLDDHMSMHVADAHLRSVGELGYICYDWWRTIRLYEHPAIPNPYPEANKYHKVLDKFSIWTNDYRRGLVNINTTNVDLLASVFFEMPEEEYSTNRLTTWATAQQIARDIISNRPYTNLSELGESAIPWASRMTGPTEICKEAGIRNAAGLLTVRDNLFTVVIRADSFSSAIGGDDSRGVSLGTARAVAEIWRDPIKDSNGNNKCLVRSFRYLED